MKMTAKSRIVASHAASLFGKRNATVRARALRQGIVTILVMFLSACAGTQSRHTDPEGDPWEGFNRKIHSFNMTVDKALLRPLASGYDWVMPAPFQRGVGNFFRNLDYPVTVVNLLLQGMFKEGGVSTGRFLINTTIGVVGFFDVASKLGISDYKEDFGQTLAVWGYENSRYLVLPIFGPSTFRDGIGRSVYGYAHPVGWAAREKDLYAPMILDIIQFRATYLDEDDQILNAYDPYVFARDVYLQNRLYKIHNGELPLQDYDMYLLEEE
jgi:phospholipid-binding lipoprotein MlaA